MLDDTELEALLQDLESDRVERKSSLSAPDRVRQAICAFANDLPGNRAPGVVFVGAEDDGSCASLRVTDELLRSLADMRSDGNITPFPEIVVQKRVIRGCELAVAIVQPSRYPPVRLRGRVWIRVGPRRAVATTEEERRLIERRRLADLPFDLRSVETATLADLDLELFQNTYLPASVDRQHLTENSRSLEHQLQSLRFLGVGPDAVPSVVGALVVGRDPRAHLPGAYVQFLRIDGHELSDPATDQKEIDGPLPDLLRRLEEVFLAHVTVAADITGGPLEQRLPSYPMVALQQLARNAVLHRSYEGTHAPVRVTWFNNRIEIQNPGGPFGQVTRANFGQPGITDYRNPHLAEAMKNLGYVQRFGVGISLARKALADNGNPAPEWQVEDAHVLVTIRARRAGDR